MLYLFWFNCVIQGDILNSYLSTYGCDFLLRNQACYHLNLV